MIKKIKTNCDQCQKRLDIHDPEVNITEITYHRRKYQFCSKQCRNEYYTQIEEELNRL